jgi:septal ring factor EnvC (AmiA/AmiB activator)
VVAVSGCAKMSDLDGLKVSVTQQMDQNNKALQEQLKAMGQKLEEVAKLPSALEAEVAATTRYARDVEKSITGLRDLTARQLDVQNANITQVKTAYGNVLQQQVAMVEALSKALEGALNDLKATIKTSLDDMKKALPSAEGTIPPAPTRPTTSKETPPATK